MVHTFLKSQPVKLARVCICLVVRPVPPSLGLKRTTREGSQDFLAKKGNAVNRTYRPVWNEYPTIDPALETARARGKRKRLKESVRQRCPAWYRF